MLDVPVAEISLQRPGGNRFEDAFQSMVVESAQLSFSGAR